MVAPASSVVNVTVKGIVFWVVLVGEIVVVGKSTALIVYVVVFTASVFPARSTEKYFNVIVVLIKIPSPTYFVDAVVGVLPFVVY